MNKILKLYNEDFATKFLKEKVLPLYPEFSGIRKIEIRNHKTNVWERTYHVVIEFKVYFVCKGKEKKECLKPIFCVAHSSEPRKNVYNALDFLWKHSFGKGDLTIPRPLFFSSYFNGSFYEGINGINLYQFVRAKDKEKIEEIIPEVAAWFAKLHKIPAKEARNFNRKNSRISTVIPGVKHILERINESYPQYFSLYSKIYQHLIRQEEEFFSREGSGRWLIHGDAHPENIIRINNQETGVIDFTDICIADFTRDLGCFIQQIEYMLMRKICDQKYADKMKKLFLKSYFKSAGIKLNKDIKDRIALYYYWTAIRTATFFLIKDKPEPERASLPLQSLKNYIKEI